jgi:hypothetical protein
VRPFAPSSPVHHVPACARGIAGLSRFLTLSQSRERPDRRSAVRRFETMPSNLNLQACSNAVAESINEKNYLVSSANQHSAAD